jgi:hypothetical protein
VGVLRAAGLRDLANEGLKVKEDVSVGFDHSKSMGDSAERAYTAISTANKQRSIISAKEGVSRGTTHHHSR